MPRPGRRKCTQPRDFAWEMAFEEQVRNLPPEARPDLLAWLRRWRRHPGRVFWVMDGLGSWWRVI